MDTTEVQKQLRPYQLSGMQKMMRRTKFLNFDDMGLGKTLTSLTACLTMQDKEHYFILITCPQNALYVWKQEIEKWYHLNAMVYAGTPKQRQKLWEQFNTEKGWHFLITTYAMLKELPHRGWTAMICDEIHQAGLLNHKTQTYQLVEDYNKNLSILYLLTGTPIRQGCIDLYAPLHLIDPDRFRNYWQYVNTWCVTTQTPFGKQIERNPRNISEFRKMLDNYMIRRLKSEVLKDLPGKQRNVIPLQMTKKQQKAHNEIISELLYADEDTTVITPNQMTADLRARQILVTPRLLGIDDDGAAFEYLSSVGPDLLTSGRSFVVFTPFKQALPYIESLIQDFKLGTHIYKVHGGMTPAAFANSWQGFQEDKSKNKVLLCVIKSGASFHATEASDCFFLGYEWDFNLNVQSEDRLCRLGQENFVNCNYLLHMGDTVDDLVKEKLNDKQLASNWIIGTDNQYHELLRKTKAVK